MKYDKKKFKMFVNSSAVFFLLTLTDVFRSYIFSKSIACFFMSSFWVSLNSANLSLLSV